MSIFYPFFNLRNLLYLIEQYHVAAFVCYDSAEYIVIRASAA